MATAVLVGVHEVRERVRRTLAEVHEVLMDVPCACSPEVMPRVVLGAREGLEVHEAVQADYGTPRGLRTMWAWLSCGRGRRDNAIEHTCTLSHWFALRNMAVLRVRHIQVRLSPTQLDTLRDLCGFWLNTARLMPLLTVRGLLAVRVHGGMRARRRCLMRPKPHEGLLGRHEGHVADLAEGPRLVLPERAAVVRANDLQAVLVVAVEGLRSLLVRNLRTLWAMSRRNLIALQELMHRLGPLRRTLRKQRCGPQRSCLEALPLPARQRVREGHGRCWHPRKAGGALRIRGAQRATRARIATEPHESEELSETPMI